MDPSVIQQVLIVNEKAERLQFYYSVYLYVMLFLSTFPVACVLFIFRDRYLRLRPDFRAFVLHAMGVSSVLIITVALWQPVALSPLFGGYSVGVLSKFGDKGFLLGMWLCWTCMAHLGVIFSFAFLLQSYQLKVRSFLG